MVISTQIYNLQLETSSLFDYSVFYLFEINHSWRIGGSTKIHFLGLLWFLGEAVIDFKNLGLYQAVTRMGQGWG